MVRHGRLAAAATSPPRRAPAPDPGCGAGHRRDGPAGTRADARRPAEETERILAWLERPDTRLVESSGGWASPARGAARFTDLLDQGRSRAPTGRARPFAHR